MAMTRWGDKTPIAVVFKHESHKLHQAFNVADGKKVHSGDPVVLLDSGDIRSFEAGDTMNKVIGYAITDSITPAYEASRQAGPIEVTVAVTAYMVINGVAGEEITAGNVVPNGARGTGSNEIYAAYVQATTEQIATNMGTRMVALNAASEGELVQIAVY